MKDHTTDKETARLERANQSRRIIEQDTDRTLRRISTAIWILATGCLVLAVIVWAVLLRDRLS